MVRVQPFWALFDRLPTVLESFLMIFRASLLFSRGIDRPELKNVFRFSQPKTNLLVVTPQPDLISLSVRTLDA